MRIRFATALLMSSLMFSITSCGERSVGSEQQPVLTADEGQQLPPVDVDGATAKLDIEYYEGGGISGATLHHMRVLHNVEVDDHVATSRKVNAQTTVAILKLLEEEGFWAALSNVNPHAMDMINHSLRVCVNDQVHLVRVQTGSSTDETKVDRIAERILRLLPPSQRGDE